MRDEIEAWRVLEAEGALKEPVNACDPAALQLSHQIEQDRESRNRHAQLKFEVFEKSVEVEGLREEVERARREIEGIKESVQGRDAEKLKLVYMNNRWDMILKSKKSALERKEQFLNQQR